MCDRCGAEEEGYGLFGTLCKECDEQAEKDQEKHY